MARKLQFKLPFDQDLEAYLTKTYPELVDFHLVSKSLDARGAGRGKKPVFHYNIDAIWPNESFDSFNENLEKKKPLSDTPIIVGAGPAGLFCALRLLEYGIPSIILERGAPANDRMKHIARFWRYGEFDDDNNVCYGEGGAGLFSDGKLITRVKSPLIKYVMRRLVDFGAPEEILYESNPHLGSNKIRGLISKLTERLVQGGCSIQYHAKVEGILFNNKQAVGVRLSGGKTINSSQVILATGHSAHQIYEDLLDSNVEMKRKDFSVGVRVEHSRREMDQMQFGNFAGHPALGTARYRLSYHDKSNERGTYSFCMCPGGYVLSSGTEADGIVVNGMSNFSRNSPWSNAALVVTVKSDQDLSSKDLLAGARFQKEIEQRAFKLSKKHADSRGVPAQTIQQFMEGKSPEIKGVKTSCPSGVFSQELDQVLPDFISKQLREALQVFERQIPGFISKNGLLLAPETRTSAPIQIKRDKLTLESTSHRGFYPCGEGAGHAGGITSAAIDGINVADQMIAKYF